MRRALVTGISGQDGIILSRLLDKIGVQITGTTRSVDKTDLAVMKSRLPKSVNLISLDMSNLAEWMELLGSNRFDVIFHMAAQSSVGQSFREPLENIVSPASIAYNLLEAMRTHQPATRLVLAGSTEVFGSNGKLNITEISEKKPMSPYAVGKLNQASIANFYKNCYAMNVSIAFLSNHESVYRSDQFVTMKIVNAAYEIAEKRLSEIKLGNLSVTRDWGWAAEYMQALKLMGEVDQPEDLIIATGTSISLLEFTREVFNYFGLTFEKHVKYDSNLLRVADPAEVHYNVEKASHVLNWEAKLKGLAVPRKLADTFYKSNS